MAATEAPMVQEAPRTPEGVSDGQQEAMKQEVVATDVLQVSEPTTPTQEQVVSEVPQTPEDPGSGKKAPSTPVEGETAASDAPQAEQMASDEEGHQQLQQGPSDEPACAAPDTQDADEGEGEEDVAPTAAAASVDEAEMVWEELVADGKVRKRTLKPGKEEKPELHSVCLVHYVGKHQDDESVFVDTKTENNGEPLSMVAGRELVKRNQGLNMALLHMTVGEVCMVEVAAEYGYGETGSFSFPCVKPSAPLVYEVELVACSPPAEKDKKDMFFEERLEAAQRLRMQGKELFAAGDYEGTLGRIKIAHDYVDEELLYQLQGHYLDSAQDVKAPLHLNAAACHLKLENWSAALEEATMCLKTFGPGTKDLEPKALFRRAKANVELQRSEEALKDLQAAQKLAPADRAVVQEIARVKKQQKEQDAAVANLFRSKLSRSTPQANATEEETEQPAQPAEEEATPSGLWGLISMLLAFLQKIISLFTGRISVEAASNST